MIKTIISPQNRPKFLDPKQAWVDVKHENGETRGVTQAELLYSIEKDLGERGVAYVDAEMRTGIKDWWCFSGKDPSDPNSMMTDEDFHAFFVKLAMTDPYHSASTRVSKATFLYHMFQLADMQGLKFSALKPDKVEELWTACGGSDELDANTIEKDCATSHYLLHDITQFFDASQTKGGRRLASVGWSWPSFLN